MNFKEFAKKIPWWCWVLFPMAIVLLVMFFRRGNGPGWLGKPPSDPGMRPGPVAVTPKEGEEIKEEIFREAEEEIKPIEAEQDEVKAQVDEWLDDLK